MRIGINAQLLSYSQNYRNGGISRYIRSLLTGLARQPGEHEYIIFVNGREVIERFQEVQPAPAQMTFVPAAWSESQPITRIAWEQFHLPRALREQRVDVFHSPANVLPEQLPRECSSVVTLHDLAFLRYPEALTRAKRLYHRTFTIRSLRRADRVIAVSESTRRDAIELAGMASEHIQTVYPCIDARFSRVITDEEIHSFRQKHGLDNGYLLYLGTLEPRKNIPVLLEAYTRMRTGHGRKEKLVLAGGKGWLYEDIFTQARRSGVGSDILFPGFVSDGEQLLWYHAASAFVYPSLYEGFGFPVAEALACGVPVVTSNVSSLPEAGAELALTVDPFDVDALAAAMARAISDAGLAQRCRAMAPISAQRFSSERLAEHTIAVYEEAATLKSERNVSLVR